jgi:sugar/nucleoside kinase (ribokinase family)
MSITVVGSIAYDAVKTPFGERERMLGGAAVHFALAASFFDRVRVVGPVGDDFGEVELDVLRGREVDVSDVERVPGGKTFFWRGEYGWDLNSRETLDTQLGVFEGFAPKLSADSRASEVLFLANIQPDLQREVRAQLPGARFVALDSMNLWIEIARDSLLAAIESVDCVILNDAELRQLTGKPNLFTAAREVLSWTPAGASGSAAGASGSGAPRGVGGPQVIVAKQGEYGAALITRERFFSLPAFPLENVIDPTGAGDSFAGGFVGYIAAHLGEDGASGDAGLSDELLRAAMAHGTALASFNVEEFGTERVVRLTDAEIAARVQSLREIASFSATAS